VLRENGGGRATKTHNNSDPKVQAPRTRPSPPNNKGQSWEKVRQPPKVSEMGVKKRSWVRNQKKDGGASSEVWKNPKTQFRGIEKEWDLMYQNQSVKIGIIER